jgi:hypothetical protein
MEPGGGNVVWRKKVMSTISRKCLILTAITILTLVYAGFVLVSRANENEGYQPTGAWAWTITSPMGSAPALVTLHQGGTVSVSTASMFKFGNFPPFGYSSPGHGVWERTGPRSFGGATLYMLYDGAGTQNGFMRACTALNFAGDPDHIEGLMSIEMCPGCTDPLSEDMSWTPAILVNVSGTRIQKVEGPE